MAQMTQKALPKLKYVFTHPNTDTKYKTRCFFVRTYVPEQAFKQLLSECDAYAYILHNAEDCEPHHHILLHYPNAHVITAIGRKFEVLAKRYPVNDLVQKTFIEITASKEDAYKYLTHTDVSSKQANKVQYSDTAIIGENVDVFTKDTQRRTSSAIDILDDINAGLTFRDLACKYGTQVVVQYARFKEFADRMFEQENPRYTTAPIFRTLEQYLTGGCSASSLLCDVLDLIAFDFYGSQSTDCEALAKCKDFDAVIENVADIYNERKLFYSGLTLTDKIESYGFSDVQLSRSRDLMNALEDKRATDFGLPADYFRLEEVANNA